MCWRAKTDTLETEDKRFQGWETKNRIPTFIMAKRDRARGCRRAVLRAITCQKVAGQQADAWSATTMVAKHLAALVLLDTDLPDSEADDRPQLSNTRTLTVKR